MPSARTPLLASANSSAESVRSDHLAEQEDAALHAAAIAREGYGNAGTAGGRRSARLREILLFVWAFLATAAVIVLATWLQHGQQTKEPSEPSTAAATANQSNTAAKPTKRNLIFMVSDGMGPASLSLTRSFRQFVEDLPINDTLVLDRHFWGTSRTRSSSSLVTDSAAGATAFSCGLKSYNGAISMLPHDQYHAPCGTVLEAAKRAGYLTGLVVTTDLTDATPACFASHVRYRSQNDEIALHEIGEGPLGRVVDLMLGGGRCHFLPNSTTGSHRSCRADNVDVVSLAQKKHGWTYIDDRAGFDQLALGENVQLPTLGAFAYYDFPFAMDRNHKPSPRTYPSLPEMAATALRALEKASADSDKGFFLMIEGSRIDHAGHINDPAAQVHEVLEYDQTFQVVKDFLDRSDTEGLVVSTSDHETGGLSTALQEPHQEPIYNWYPHALARVKVSSKYLSHLLRRHVRELKENHQAIDRASLRSWIHTNLLVPHLGIHDPLEEELDLLVASPEHTTTVWADIISLRAHVGWSTHGHSAVDVNIYSYAPSDSAAVHAAAAPIHGNIENTDIGRFLRNYLDVDVEPITRELIEKMKKEKTQSVDLDDAWATKTDAQMEGRDATGNSIMEIYPGEL